MKISIRIYFTILAMVPVFCTLPARASMLENANGYNAFGGTGTAQGTTNSYYVAGNYTIAPGTPQLVFAKVSSDLATSKLQFYSLTNQVSIGANVSGTTNITVSSTNGFAPGNVVLIKHIASDTYERLPLFNVQNTNQLVLTYPPITACGAGDLLWVAVPAGYVGVGATTNFSIGPLGFTYSGQYGKPLLMDINGTSTATITLATGDYLK